MAQIITPKQLVETMAYLGYSLYDENNNITDQAKKTIDSLLAAKIVESTMLPSIIATEWAKNA